MAMQNVGRPTAPAAAAAETGAGFASLTGGRGLLQDEPLIFETAGWQVTGVDLAPPEHDAADLGDLVRTAPIGLPGLTEPEAVRHYVRLSQKNHAIDLALYPLGSCTMKHNPRLNEKLARLPGFADLHPLQPQATTKGTLMLMDRLAQGAPFTDLARDYSEDPESAPRGGDLGLVPLSAVKRAPAPLRDAVLAMEPGRARVVNQGNALAIVFMVAKEKGGQRDLSTPGVKEQISNTLKARKEQLLRTAYLSAARNDAKVDNILARTVVKQQTAAAPPAAATPPAAAPGAPR